MEKQLKLYALSEDILDICVDLFIDIFSSEPWNDVYDSKKQVTDFFENHMNNNYFVGYVLKDEDNVVALSIGMKKPWINGMEYYIDQFCVKVGMQGMGVGSHFLKLIEEEIKAQGMNAIILNTEKGFPSEKFYLKNGLSALDELVILAK
ncbi:GNAT family N-acetyltransferase [Anaerosporobacter sp.]